MTILPNGIFTNQNLPQRMKRLKFFEILKYKQITQSWLEYQTYCRFTRKRNMLSCRFCRSHSPPSENKRERKDRQILEPCQLNKRTLVTMTPTVIGELGTIPKSLEKNCKNWKSEEKSRPLLRSARILRTELEICDHSDSIPSGNTG